MRALVLENGSITLRDVPFFSNDDECTIRVVRAGICGTDLQLLEGYADFTGIPGHEFVGIVERAPDRDRHWIGRRVVGEINVGCGTCDVCRARIKEHCPNRTVVGIRGRSGAFAEYVALPATNLHEVPAGVDDDAAVFVEPIAAACRILEQIDIDYTVRVAILGDGRMGLLVAQALKTKTPDITLFGRHDQKIRIARGLGLDARSVEGATSPAGVFDVVVDVTGRAGGLQRALELVRPRGTVIMKTTSHDDAPFVSWPAVVNEVTLLGSRCGPFKPALDLLAAGAVRTRPLIAAVLPISEYEQAFARARSEIKLILTP